MSLESYFGMASYSRPVPHPPAARQGRFERALQSPTRRALLDWEKKVRKSGRNKVDNYTDWSLESSLTRKASKAQCANRYSYRECMRGRIVSPFTILRLVCSELEPARRVFLHGTLVLRSHRCGVSMNPPVGFASAPVPREDPTLHEPGRQRCC